MAKLMNGEKDVKPDYPIIFWLILVHLLALPALWTFTWANFAVFFVMYFLTGCIGVTLTFHRLLTHRSFEVPKWFERILTTIASLSLQGSPLEWVGHHRMHHAGSDTPKDPHNAARGFWYSHWGWLFVYSPEFDDHARLRKFARDIWADPYYRFLDKQLVQVALQVILGLTFLYFGGWGMVFWGIFLRLVFVYHVTWLVNSAAHIWGYRRYPVADTSANCWWVGILAFGEGWHNNHHAHPQVAEAGHMWWEIDVTMGVIRLLEALGLASHIKSTHTLSGKKLTKASAGGA